MKSPEAISGILAGVLKHKGLLKKIHQYSVFEVWQKIVGPTIAKQATPKKMQGQTLVVQTKSASWASELSFMKPAILKRIKENVPDAEITDLRFVTI